MGGYGSNRWGGMPVRATTGASLSLTTTKLKPYFVGGPWKMGWQWQSGSEEPAKVGLYVGRDGMVLDYTITRLGGEPQAVRDAVPVVWTACNYGGEQAWFVCPGCKVKRRVLYLPPRGTYFRCQKCHNLAYSTQQMDTHDRHMHRIRVIEQRLGADEGTYSPFRVPPKPKGMWWLTYLQLQERFLMHEIARQKILQARFEIHWAQWVKQGLLPE